MIHSILQIGLYLACIPLLFIFFRATGYRFNKVSIPTVFFLAFIFQVLVSFPFFFMGVYLYDPMRDQVRLYQMFANTLLGLTCIFLGIAAVNYGKKRQEPPVDREFHGFQYGFAVLLLAVSVEVMVLYFKSLSEVPFFALLRGATAGELDILRSDSASGYTGGKIYYYTMFIHGLLPFLSQYFFATFLLTRKKLSFIIWIISFVATCIALLSTLHKAPIVYYFLFTLMLWAWIRGKKIKWSAVMLVMVGGFSLIVLFYASIRSYGLGDAVPQMLNRAVLGQVRDSYYYLEMFPEKVSYLMGQSMGLPKFMSPFDSKYNLSVEVMNYIYPGIYTEMVGRANTVYWGEIHANFGFFAIPFLSFAVGIYIGLVQRVLEKRITALNAALFLFFVEFFIILVASGISRISPLNSKFMLVMAVCVPLYLLQRVRLFKIPVARGVHDPAGKTHA